MTRLTAVISWVGIEHSRQCGEGIKVGHDTSASTIKAGTAQWASF